MTPREYLIYGLRDPRTMEIRYVGQTSLGLRRPRMHWYPSGMERNGNMHLVGWLRSLGGPPEVVVLQRLDISLAENQQQLLDDAEERWIAIGRSALGDRFTNLKNGGNTTTGWSHPDATRQKLQTTHRQLAQTPERQVLLRRMTDAARRSESIAKMTVSLKRYYESEEVRQRSSEIHKQMSATEEGRRHQAKMVDCARTPEARAKNSAAKRAFAKTPEGRAHLERLVQAQRTPEAKQKAAESRRRYLATPAATEHYKKLSAASHTPEAIAKIADGVTRFMASPAGLEQRDRDSKRMTARMRTEEGRAQVAKSTAVIRTDEVRAKMSALAKARAATPEGQRRMAAARAKAREVSFKRRRAAPGVRGDVLRAWRKSFGVSRVLLAKQLRVGCTTIKRLENGCASR